jgi:hypothetical protein
MLLGLALMQVLAPPLLELSDFFTFSFNLFLLIFFVFLHFLLKIDMHRLCFCQFAVTFRPAGCFPGVKIPKPTLLAKT